MTPDELHRAVLDSLRAVAPEADLDHLDPDAAFARALDLDSVNTMGFLVEIEARTGITVPERDYAKVATVTHCIEYLEHAQAATHA